ncbi:D-amino-acid transaminase [Bacillus horti]|uniref:D-alanine aminotransferase n=1 Tax=Caldalkalibacillus horti TaxID=77523 RepID=A0ABT9W1E5_9BACI|nr:D-amino-acid transaminase [Bacillus horti]MDQ0166909.1 D-alanine transaminase [Bacillus horti]
MAQVLINGEIVTRIDAKVDIEDRAYQFGDGIYEVIRVYNGICYQLEEHIQRLERSAKEIRLSLPFSAEEFTQQLQELVKGNQLQEGIIYTQVTRGVAPRYHGFPSDDVKPQFVAYTKDLPRPTAFMEHGVKAVLLEDVRWLRCDIKSLNLLGNVLAKQKANDEGGFEAIQHRGDIVTEGSSSNVFLVQEGILYTHPASSLILNGITRVKVLELCEKLELIVKEQEFTVKDLLDADEVFITSTTSEVMPITQIDDQPVGPGIPGPLTVKLQQEFVKGF